MTPTPEPAIPQRILVPVLAGIGNAVMAVPLVRRLGQVGRVTVAARTEAIADVFRGLSEVAQVEVLGLRHGRAWQRHRRLVRDLRPDLYVVPFPSNRWQYALLAAASGAGHVVMHDYPAGRLRALRFLPGLVRTTSRIAAERGLHDVVQNLRLLRALGLDDATQEPPVFPFCDSMREEARRQLAPLGLGEDLVVLQPGCGDTPVGRAKRWPAQKFAQLADALAELGRNVGIIEGPDERGVGRHIAAAARSRPPVIELNGPLSRSAALLELAALYVGNDSGLAHVAAAVGTPPVTIFAAADPVRVAPYGYEHLVVTPPAVNGRAWTPRLMYPMDHPGPKLRDAGGIDWAAHVRVEDVLAVIDRATSAAPPRDAGVTCAGSIRA